MFAARILITALFVSLTTTNAFARFIQHHGHRKLSIPPIVFLEINTKSCQSPCPLLNEYIRCSVVNAFSSLTLNHNFSSFLTLAVCILRAARTCVQTRSHFSTGHF